jgi:hypothetical protein
LGLGLGVAVGEGVAGAGAVVRSWIGGGVSEPPAPPTRAIASAATAMQLAMVRV